MFRRYSAILEKKDLAGYLKLKSYYEEGENMLRKKRLRAEEIAKKCCFCEWRCGVDRRSERGVCSVLYKPLISSFFTHYGEESILVPSFTIFFSGCNFHCVFCQNWDISQSIVGEYIPPEKMARIIEGRRGIRNVNWVGGEPTPNIHYVLSVLEYLDRNIPQVWNSNMYMSEEAMEILNGVVDLYLSDFKYGNDNCALKYSRVKNYFEVVSRNHKIAYEQADLLIRHLIMPGHVECCTKPVLKWIADNTPNAAVNLMAQYHPDYIAYKFPEINRRIRRSEYLEAYKYAKELGIKLVDEERWLLMI